MQDTLERAQHYLDLALQMHKTAELEHDMERRAVLIGLAGQYEKLAAKLFATQQDNAALNDLSHSPASA